MRTTFRDLAEAACAWWWATVPFNEVISKREELAGKAKVLLQKYLDEAETGIKVVNVEMKKTNVPEPVQPSFNEVNEAIQEKERMIYQAKEAYNKVIPAARETPRRPSRPRKVTHWIASTAQRVTRRALWTCTRLTPNRKT